MPAQQRHDAAAPYQSGIHHTGKKHYIEKERPYGDALKFYKDCLMITVE